MDFFMSRELYIQVMVIPALVGIFLLRQYLVSRDAEKIFDLIAAILTLKPLVTTPIWLMILNVLSAYDYPMRALYIALSILPGAGFTALIVVIFRSSFLVSGINRTRKLLVLDCIRWLNSFFMIVLLSTPLGLANLFLPILMAQFGLVMPSFYALFACAKSFEKTTQKLMG